MRVITIKTREWETWDTRESKWPIKTEAACRSKIQHKVGTLIKKKYPLDPILEDITLPRSRLSLDFFLPQRKIAIEVQGKQHKEYIPFFHKTKSSFDNQLKRDEEKEMFCQLNGIELIYINSEQEAIERFS
jgi:hypothetical protein